MIFVNNSLELVIRTMPIIERKSLDRLNSDDILYYDAGNLIKAGTRVGDNIPVLARYNVSFVTVISLSREEKSLLQGGKEKQYILDYIGKRKRKEHDDLKFNMKNTLQDFHEIFAETDRSFSISGKRTYLEENELLSRKLDPLNYNSVQAGSYKIIDRSKLKYVNDLLVRFQSFYDKLKPLEKGEKASRGSMGRLHVNSIRLNSYYDNSKLSKIGDSIVNQSIDTALLFLHTFTNINKKRIIEGRPFSESRWDPTQRKTDQGLFQYKPEMILEAALGVLLHNVGNAHRSIHQIISGKPMLSAKERKDRDRIRLLQKSVFILKHLLDREDISSISRMMCIMQRDYPDGTGYPLPNENRYLFEFVRLFQIIDFYDRMTNPVVSKTVFSRMDVINYIAENSGTYKYSPEKPQANPKFDSNLVDEFFNVLAPYDINEKVYLYQKGKRNHPLFVGKVVSYPDSHYPLVSVFKDEKNGRSYRDGTVFLHVPSSSLFLKNKDKTVRKKFQWIGDLEIYDKNTNAGNLDEYIDPVSGSVRPLKLSSK